MKHRTRAFIAYLRRLHNSEPLILVALLLCAGAVLGFVEIADDVMEGDTHEIDTQLLLALRENGQPDNPWGPRWLEEMMRDFTGLGGIAVLTFLTASSLVYLLALKRYGHSLYLLAAVLTGTMLSNALKFGFDRPRPDLVPHGSFIYTASFPSGHAMISAVVYLTLGAILSDAQPHRRLKIFTIALSVVLTLLIGSSRVYLGVHWPSDVLAGWVGGAAWALLFWVGARYLRFHGGLTRGG